MAAMAPVLLLSVAGGIISGIGSMQEGEANAQAYEASADAAGANKVIADQDRRLAVQTAQADASDKTRENRRTLASLRAAYGASGGDFSGSQLDVLRDTATEGELDTTRILTEGRNQNRRGALQMLGFQRDQDMALSAAKNSRRAGFMNAIGDVVGGIGSGLARAG